MTFKKLDDLPRKPHSVEDVMRAMTELHRLVTLQAAAYGGKNSKLIRAQVTEGSLLRSFEAQEEDDVVQESLEQAQSEIRKLATSLDSDKRGALIRAFLALSAAVKETHR